MCGPDLEIITKVVLFLEIGKLHYRFYKKKSTEMKHRLMKASCAGLVEELLPAVFTLEK